MPVAGRGAEGVVVLRNGNVLAGSVQHVGPHYVIENAGASLQVPAEQVEMACGSLVEAYERRRRERVGGSADSHAELARWCLRHGLLDQAAREILDTRTRDPRHSALASLDTLLRQMLEIEVGRRAREAAAADTPTTTEVASPPAPAVSLITPSTDAQVTFVRSIQPMLIHNCATGGCHQHDSPQQMRLDRWALDGNGNPDRIRQNLEAVLAQINAADPASSPVLLRARQPHGPNNRNRSKSLATYQVALLIDWLNEAAGVKPASTADAEPVESAPAEPATLPAEETPTTPATPGESTLPLTDAAKVPAPRTFTPRDAFDPEIFNRMIAEQAARAQLPESELSSEASNAGVADGSFTEQPPAAE